MNAEADRSPNCKPARWRLVLAIVLLAALQIAAYFSICEFKIGFSTPGDAPWITVAMLAAGQAVLIGLGILGGERSSLALPRLWFAVFLAALLVAVVAFCVPFAYATPPIEVWVIWVTLAVGVSSTASVVSALVARWFGWRWTATPISQAERQFSLRRVVLTLIGSALICALARWVYEYRPGIEIEFDKLMPRAPSITHGIIAWITLVIAGGLSACALAVVSAAGKRIGWEMLLLTLLGAAILAWGLDRVVRDRPWHGHPEVEATLFAVLISAVFGSLLVLRAFGWRIDRLPRDGAHRPRETSSPTGASSLD